MIRKGSLVPLYQIFDSLFPLGSYALSNGMETYTQKGLIHDRKTLEEYLKAQLYLLPYGDLGIAAKVAQGEDFKLMDDYSSAMKQPFEIRQGSVKIGTRLLRAVKGLTDYQMLELFGEAIKKGDCEGHYPVAVGLLLKELEVNLQEALEIYAYSLLSMMANHAVKLVPLGQAEAQPALYETIAHIPDAVAKALAVRTEELGVSGCGFDLRAIQHETLHGRLFGS